MLRVGVGAVFLAHGLQKFVLWGWGGGADVFADAGIPLPGPSSVAVSLIESLGGAALLVGFLTRYAAAALATVMAVALVAVHLPHGFFLPGGIEFVLVLGLACLALVLDGGGPGSVDGVRARDGGETGMRKCS